MNIASLYSITLYGLLVNRGLISNSDVIGQLARQLLNINSENISIIELKQDSKNLLIAKTFTKFNSISIALIKIIYVSISIELSFS